MMKKAIIFIGLLFPITVSFCQSVVAGPFDEEKWSNNGNYRYDLILRSNDIFYEATHGKSESEIVDILGKPFKREEVTNSSILMNGHWQTADKAINLQYCLGNAEPRSLDLTLFYIYLKIRW
ncbi:MAG: hypothetical protein ACJAUV_000367 [Flavobacteriales bacterium]|jgi:hypothetical protein